MKNSILGAIYLSLAASIWGGMYVISKYVLGFVPPFTLLWLRYCIAFAFLFGIWQFTRHKQARPDRLNWKTVRRLAWIGFIGYFVSVGTQFIGTKLADAHTGALLTSASPAFVILFARLFLHEPLTWQKVSALLLSTGGVLIVVGWGNHQENSFLGELFLLAAAITWALLTVSVRQAAQYHSPLTTTTFALGFALILTTPLMLWEILNTTISWSSSPIVLWGGIVYLGLIATAAAFFLWNKGMEFIEAGIGSLFFFFQPIVGAFLGWLLLGEKLRWNFFFGGSFILLGVLLATVDPRTLLRRRIE